VNAAVKVIDQVSMPMLGMVSYKRGLRYQMIQDVLPLVPIKHSMVGIAYTMRYIRAREDTNKNLVFSGPKHPQRAAIDGRSTACPSTRPSICASDGMHNFHSDSGAKHWQLQFPGWLRSRP